MRVAVSLLLAWASNAFSALEVPPIIELRAVNGVTVSVVAVEAALPEGLRLAVLPTQLSVGSDVSFITVPWDQIDRQSLTNSALGDALQTAQGGMTTSLRLGPHYFDLKLVDRELAKLNPTITVLILPKQTFSFPLVSLLTDAKLFHRWGNYADRPPGKALRTGLFALADKLEVIKYRSDARRLHSDLTKAAEGLEAMAQRNSVFDVMAARALQRVYP